MSKRYFYGLAGEELYTATDIDSAYEEIRDANDDDAIGKEIIELSPSKKMGRVCVIDACCEPDPECVCRNYKPRNGKKGICMYLQYGLKPTGAKWKITGDYQYKKLSGRKAVKEVGW